MKGALVHSGVDATSAGGTARLKSAALFLVKLAVTAACFWYVARQVNAPAVGRHDEAIGGDHLESPANAIGHEAR